MGNLEDLRNRNTNGNMDKFIKAVSKTSVGRTSNYKKNSRKGRSG